MLRDSRYLIFLSLFVIPERLHCISCEIVQIDSLDFRYYICCLDFQCFLRHAKIVFFTMCVIMHYSWVQMYLKMQSL